jgi:ubiquinone/menaquinone biosynthesis C-methylase UbiE
MFDRYLPQQHLYYVETAAQYDSLHGSEFEHNFALNWLIACLEFYKFESVLDIGAGTGRVNFELMQKLPQVKCVGIEPVSALREKGHLKGINPSHLIEGDAYHLAFPDSSFDIVTEFGILHHVKQPELVIAEMLRVAKKAIFISDANNWGQGSIRTRRLKSILRKLKLWRLANFVKTRGKGYAISEGDGLFYSYSVFNNYNLIKAACSQIFILNTQSLSDSIHPLVAAPSVALLGIK